MNRIGVDIGGTSLRAAVVDENGKITDRTETVNRKDLTPTENLKPLADFINAHKENAAGIGIGCPGPLDPFDGRILNAPNLPGWENFKVTDYFEDQTGLHTELTNDANAAGLAEALAGAGKGQDSVYFLTVSTGVGGAFVYKD
jgi:glucokinase